MPMLHATLSTGPMLHATLSGSMSMWASTHDTLVAYKSEGSACKFADRKMGGLTAVIWLHPASSSELEGVCHTEATAQTPYITAKNYCAVNRGLFGNGEVPQLL